MRDEPEEDWVYVDGNGARHRVEGLVAGDVPGFYRGVRAVDGCLVWVNRDQLERQVDGGGVDGAGSGGTETGGA
jgi:hypothetical protein